MRLAIVANPLDPAQWSDAIIPEMDVPFDWLETPDREEVLTATHARMERALTLWHDRGQEDAVAHIVNRVFERHGVTDDNEPVRDPDVTGWIIAEIAHQVAHHALGLRHDRPMSSGDIYGLRDKGKPRPR